MFIYNSPWPKKRIGSENDGGYVICMIPDGYDYFISGGISSDVTFECHLLDMYPALRCDAFDGSIKELPMHHERMKFKKKFLGEHEDLSTFIKPYSNIFMKIDIEGHEFKLLPRMMANGTIQNVKQLVVEFHSPELYKGFPEYYQGVLDVVYDDMIKTMKDLNKTHRLVHMHPNNACPISNGMPTVFECTYIRSTENLPLSLESIPSKIDKPNIVGRPDIIRTMNNDFILDPDFVEPSSSDSEECTHMSLP